MGGVRAVAGVFLVLGWITVAVGLIVTLGTLAGVSSMMRGNAGILGLASALVPLGMTLIASLSPFFLWALLRALIEIHTAQEAAVHLMRRAERERA